MKLIIDMPKFKTHNQFLEKLYLKNKHYRSGTFKVIGTYVCAKCHIEVEDMFGKLSVKACELLLGKRPSIQAALNKDEYFINKANFIHSYKYKYLEINYTKNTDKVQVVCPEHGLFEQEAKPHLQKHGCPQCGLKRNNSFSKEKYMEKYNTMLLYLIRCYNDTENFYKIGFTGRSLKERFPSELSMPYSYEVVGTYTSDTESIYNLEKEIKEYIKEEVGVYRPKLKFDGHTECFLELNDKVNKVLHSLLHTTPI